MGTLARFIVGRMASAALTLFGVSVVIFTAIRLIPGKFEEVLVPRGTEVFCAAWPKNSVWTNRFRCST